MNGAANTLRIIVYGLTVALGSISTVIGADNPAEDQPITPPTKQFLHFTHLDGYLELEGEFNHSKNTSTSLSRINPRNSQRNREWRLEERIGLVLGGYYIDPKFINFNGEISFALTQNRFKEDFNGRDQTDRDNGYLSQFDLRANFFQGLKLSGSIYGLRRDDRINRRFQPTLNQLRTGFGTSWVRRDQTIPMEFTYDYLETDRTGNRDRSDDEHYTESSFRYGLEWIKSQHNRAKFDYEHSESKQEYQGLRQPFETTRDLLNFEHQYHFGPKRKHTLRNLIHWQEESGDFARDIFQIGPELTLVHNDQLQTFYKYQFNRERYEGLDIESQRADFQITHQLYRNLTTTLGLFGLYEDIEDDINTVQFGALIDWQYNRKNKWGHLYANLALAYDTEDVEGDNGSRVVIDEAHNFRQPVALTLRNRNVIPVSIIVTDTTNRRFYRLGIDYIIHQQGNVTRITRIRTGQITEGDTVLIDYQFKTPADGQLDTIRADFSLEQRFNNGFTPYYRLSYRNQEDDTSAGFLRRADRTNHHRWGFNHKTKRYAFGGEFEIFDDSIEPYDAFNLTGQYHLLDKPNHRLSATSRFSRFFFEGGIDKRNVSLLDVSIDHRIRLSDSLVVVERLAYRFQDDSMEGNTTGWDVTAGVEFLLGELSGELTFEYDRLVLPDSKQDDYSVYFRIRREISNVLARK